MIMSIQSTVETGESVHAKLKEDMKGDPGMWVAQWRFTEIGEKEFMARMDVSNMEVFGIFISIQGKLQSDKDNGYENTVYVLRNERLKELIIQL